MSITVAIVEDNEEIRGMLARLIECEPELKCIGACASGEDALEMLPRNPPDVVIMDIQLPGISGIQCTSRLRQLLPETHVLIYTVYADDEQVFKALKAGAGGYLLKRSNMAEIREAIFDVHRGGAPLSGEIARKILRSFSEPVAARESGRFTPRQEEILALLAGGFVTKEIADRLGISFDTVRFHLKEIYAKLQVRTRTEAVLKYLR